MSLNLYQARKILSQKIDVAGAHHIQHNTLSIAQSMEFGDDAKLIATLRNAHFITSRYHPVQGRDTPNVRSL
jgi:hypothetical protein